MVILRESAPGASESRAVRTIAFGPVRCLLAPPRVRSLVAATAPPIGAGRGDGDIPWRPPTGSEPDKRPTVTPARARRRRVRVGAQPATAGGCGRSRQQESPPPSRRLLRCARSEGDGDVLARRTVTECIVSRRDRPRRRHLCGGGDNIPYPFGGGENVSVTRSARRVMPSTRSRREREREARVAGPPTPRRTKRP